MNKPKLSPDFTIEDIHKLREYNHEKRKNMTPDEFWLDVSKGADEMLKLIGKNRVNEPAVHR